MTSTTNIDGTPEKHDENAVQKTNQKRMKHPWR